MKAVLFLVGLVMIVVGVMAGNNVHLAVQDSGSTGVCGTPFSPTQMETLSHEDDMNAVTHGRRTNMEALCLEKVRTWQTLAWALVGLGVAITVGTAFALVENVTRIALIALALIAIGAAVGLRHYQARVPNEETSPPNTGTTSGTSPPLSSSMTTSSPMAALPTATVTRSTVFGPGAVAVVGSGCFSGSTPVVDPDGVRVYCARMESSDSFVWSRIPGVLPMPNDRNWDTALCVQQTGRTVTDCGAQIARATYWGDGTPPP